MTDVGFVVRSNQPGGLYVGHLQGNLVALRRSRGSDPIRLRVSVDFAVAASTDRSGWWEATTAGWVYDVLDSRGRLILSFHWHPSSGRVTWPHLHAYGAHDSVEMHKLHPPTGHVTLGSVVQFLIEDFGVLPRRPNWQAVLECHAAV